jgi:hypothetical protein
VVFSAAGLIVILIFFGSSSETELYNGQQEAFSRRKTKWLIVITFGPIKSVIIFFIIM